MSKPGKRGRPVGTGPNQAHDERLLQQAARQLFYGLSPNATSAFKSMLDPADAESPNALRRLQRQWQHRGQLYLDDARRHAFSSRWQFEAGQLEKASPELSRTINTFAASAIGMAVLLKYGKNGVPAEPMSVGIVALWEEITRHSAVGPLRADELFEQAYASWSVTGLEPDEAFLRRFAELCTSQADKLRERTNMHAADDDPIGTAVPQEDFRDER